MENKLMDMEKQRMEMFMNFEDEEEEEKEVELWVPASQRGSPTIEGKKSMFSLCKKSMLFF